MEGRRAIRFGTFEANPATGELRKAGRRINLQDQPFRLLLLLLEHPGEVVTRNELREKLWGETYVDFEEGLNTAIRKLRDALGDSAANPRFIETLPRRGYRFIAPAEAAPEAERSRPTRPIRRLGLLCGCAAALTGAGLLLRNSLFREKPDWTASPPIQITRDSGLTSEPVISKDGKLLAYASDRAGESNLDIWVQYTSGGQPRRLTDDPADDHEPEISPDGSTVVFRSEREPRGIYSVSTLGGDEPRLVVKDGYFPRYSPDGSRIAYAIGVSGTAGFGGKLYVHTLATASKQAMAPDLFVSGPATWSPDGESLVFAGSHDVWLRPLDLWISPAKGGVPAKMGAPPISEGGSLIGQISTVSVAWFRNQLIVAVKQGDSSNLWSGTISPGTRRLTGDLRRLTLGSGNEALPSVSADGKLVFTSHTYSAGIWEAMLGKDPSTPSLRRITQDRATNYRPSVSTDGAKMAYLSDRGGNFDVWIKNLVSGGERALTRSTKAVAFAAISRDGSQVAFWDRAGIYLTSTNDGAARLLCERCGRPDDWTPDGKLIIAGLEHDGIFVRDPTTASSNLIAGYATWHTTAPNISPNGRWLTFHAAQTATMRFDGKRKIFIAPFTGRQVPQSNWIPVTDGSALDREPRWSSDGNRIYFLSDRDGFRCIWARNLEAKTKQPVGSIYPVVHLHNPHMSLLHISDTGNVSICPVGDGLIFAMGELSGNIWMTDLHQK